MLKEILDPLLRAAKGDAVELQPQAAEVPVRDQHVQREIRDSAASIAAPGVLCAAARTHGDSR